MCMKGFISSKTIGVSNYNHSMQTVANFRVKTSTVEGLGGAQITVFVALPGLKNGSRSISATYNPLPR